MPSFKIDVQTALVFVSVAPEYKVVNRETGEIAVDRETKAKMKTVGLTICDDGNADTLTVSVPESGVPEFVAVGTPVAVTGLRARDWERVIGGEQRHGITFRAMAITPLTAPAQG
jgi:hypothetical protein